MVDYSFINSVCGGVCCSIIIFLSYSRYNKIEISVEKSCCIVLLSTVEISLVFIIICGEEFDLVGYLVGYSLVVMQITISGGE